MRALLVLLLAATAAAEPEQLSPVEQSALRELAREQAEFEAHYKAIIESIRAAHHMKGGDMWDPRTAAIVRKAAPAAVRQDADPSKGIHGGNGGDAIGPGAKGGPGGDVIVNTSKPKK